MTFSASAIQANLQQYPPMRRWIVAYSGGLDSHVLLHALASVQTQLIPVPLLAVHIDHAIHPDSPRWQMHCEQQCAALGIPLETLRIDVAVKPGESLEAVARQQRYQALQQIMVPGDCILSAHHRSDQAETLILQLLRGAGVQGLAAMPALAELGVGWLARPLLEFDRAQLHSYALAHHLHWLEDPSNADVAFDRNYLRHSVLPLLRARWPSCDKTIARSAAHCAEAAQLLAQSAEHWVQQVQGQQSGTLSVTGLQQLSAQQQRLVIRYWVVKRGYLVPPMTQLCQVQQQLHARASKAMVIRWSGAELRRYQDDLFLMAPLDVLPNVPIPWDLQQPLPLTPLPVQLVARHQQDRGLDVERLAAGPLSIRFRQGGETLRPVGRGCAKRLKKLLQEANIAPWLRPRIPLLFVGEELASVIGYWDAQDFAVQAGQQGVIIEQQPCSIC